MTDEGVPVQWALFRSKERHTESLVVALMIPFKPHYRFELILDMLVSTSNDAHLCCLEMQDLHQGLTLMLDASRDL